MIHVASQSTMWPFGLFALPGFLVEPLDFAAGWIGFVAAEPDFGMWPSSHS